MEPQGAAERGLGEGILRAWAAFNDAHATLTEEIDRGLRGSSGLPSRWYHALDAMPRHRESGLDQTRLAELVGLSQSATSRLVTRLEEEGLVERVRSTEDARAAILALTTLGEGRIREARQQHVAVLLERFGATIARHDLDDFVAIMDELSGKAVATRAERPNNLLGFGKSVLQVRSDASVIADTQMIREALEPLMITEAAKYASASDIVDCRRILEQMAAAVEDPASYYRADWELHARLAFIARNELLGSIYTGLLDILISQVDAVLPDAGGIPYVKERLRIHEQLVDAVESGDHATALRAAQAHEFMGAALGR